MPELPEVESVRRQLDPLLAGRRIVAVSAEPQARFHDLDRAAGRRVARLRRRGKYLLAELSADAPCPAADGRLELIMHLGMTGSFRLRGDGWTPDAYVRATFVLDDSVLDFRDVRRFGRLSVVAAGDYSGIATLAGLGPEPLGPDFLPGRFHAQLAATRMAVKPYLLTQRPVAGVGNIYADEALWRARIHPGARRVGRPRAAALWRAIREVLSEAIEREGTSFRDYRTVGGAVGGQLPHLAVYARAGLPCRRCGTPLSKVVLAGRGTCFCRRCQAR